jgi:outer membrane immunogenic protein
MELKMRSFAFALAAATAAVIATPALAQDGPPPAYGPSANGPFTGFHVDGLVGWDQLRNGGHKSGVAYGVGAGYDIQRGNIVLGIEGEATDANTRQRNYDVFATGDRLRTDAGRDLYVGGRIGTVIGGRTLLYAKAGYTNARVGVRYDDGTSAGLDDFRYHTNLDGVRVGAGAEYAIGPNSYLKAEYRYSNYEQGYSRNQIMGGFGFHF